MKLKHFFLAGGIVLASCSGPEINTELSRQLVGEWQNSNMKLEMQSYKNGDSVKVFETNSQNWESKMNIRPILTIFREDGSYNSEHRNLKDSMVYNPAGKWIIVGDSIQMTDTLPRTGEVYKYRIAINGKTAEFWGLEDCDGDGRRDDLYYSRQTRR